MPAHEFPATGQPAGFSLTLPGLSRRDNPLIAGQYGMPHVAPRVSICAINQLRVERRSLGV